jgi:hypothetical protein
LSLVRSLYSTRLLYLTKKAHLGALVAPTVNCNAQTVRGKLADREKVRDIEIIRQLLSASIFA